MSLSGRNLPVAVHDLDFTLRRGSLFEDVIALAFGQDIIPQDLIRRHPGETRRVDDFLAALPDILSVVSEKDLDQFVEKHADELALALYPFSEELLLAESELGYDRVIITHSPQTWAKLVMGRRVEQVIGTTFLRDSNGNYTGALVPDKEITVKQLGAIALAFGNTLKDLPLIHAALEANGKAFVIGNDLPEENSLHFLVHQAQQEASSPIAEVPVLHFDPHERQMFRCARALGTYGCSQEALGPQAIRSLLGIQAGRPGSLPSRRKLRRRSH